MTEIASKNRKKLALALKLRNRARATSPAYKALKDEKLQARRPKYKFAPRNPHIFSR